MTPYGENFNCLTYRDKKKIWRVIFLKVFYLCEIMGWTSGLLEITETSVALDIRYSVNVSTQQLFLSKAMPTHTVMNL